jgi:Pol polyprotein
VKDAGRNKRGMTCNFCKKKAHLKKDCGKLKSKQSDESKSNKAIAAEASYVEGEIYDDGALVVTSEYKVFDSWILDSGCSRHMTFNSKFFSTYQKVDGRKVTMGNEASCLVLEMLNSSCLMVLKEH